MREPLADSPSESERRLRQLLEHAHDIVYRVRLRPTRAFEYIAGDVEAITGHTAAEFYADPNLTAKSVHPADAEIIHRMLADPAVYERSLPQTTLLRWIHADGTMVWAEHRRVPIYGTDGELVAIEGIARNVTARVEAEERLRWSQEQLRQLAARVQSAREDERKTIARELHDELGQNLTAIKLELMRADAVFRKSQLQPQTVDRLQSLIGLVEIGISSVKRIATALRPPTLDHLGLAEAIRWEAIAFKSRTGLRCRTHATTDGSPLSLDQQIVLFRILQEALTNVVRHAKASAVHVSLTERAGVVELRVRDNGRGITTAEESHPQSIGLLGMRERATLIGGTFRIAGQHGKGTVVTVRVKATAPSTSAALNAHGGGEPTRRAS